VSFSSAFKLVYDLQLAVGFFLLIETRQHFLNPIRNPHQRNSSLRCRRPPLINRPHDFFCPAHGVPNGADGRRNPRSAVELRQLPRRKNSSHDADDSFAVFIHCGGTRTTSRNGTQFLRSEPTKILDTSMKMAPGMTLLQGRERSIARLSPFLRPWASAHASGDGLLVRVALGQAHGGGHKGYAEVRTLRRSWGRHQRRHAEPTFCTRFCPVKLREVRFLHLKRVYDKQVVCYQYDKSVRVQPPPPMLSTTCRRSGGISISLGCAGVADCCGVVSASSAGIPSSLSTKQTLAPGIRWP